MSGSHVEYTLIPGLGVFVLTGNCEALCDGESEDAGLARPAPLLTHPRLLRRLLHHCLRLLARAQVPLS